jgi:hypothetical protein
MVTEAAAAVPHRRCVMSLAQRLEIKALRNVARDFWMADVRLDTQAI